MSFSQFGTLLDVEPSRITNIHCNYIDSSITIVLADEGELTMAQPSGAFPQLNTGGKKVGGKKSGKRGC